MRMTSVFGLVYVQNKIRKCDITINLRYCFLYIAVHNLKTVIRTLKILVIESVTADKHKDIHGQKANKDFHANTTRIL